MCRSATPAELELVEKDDDDVTTILVDDDKWDELASDTPYSRKPIMTLCFAMFANSVALTNVFPYAGFLVMHYGLTEDETQVGYYAGWLMTSFMAGRLLSSFYSWQRFLAGPQYTVACCACALRRARLTKLHPCTLAQLHR